MYKTGVYFGRFCPPHRGHQYQIMVASTKCERLIVVISDNRTQTEAICREAGLPTITYQLRKQWLGQQVQDMEHIKVRVLDETDIPVYPTAGRCGRTGCGRLCLRASTPSSWGTGSMTCR